MREYWRTLLYVHLGVTLVRPYSPRAAGCPELLLLILVDYPQHVLSLQSSLRGGCTQTRHESQCHVISSCHWNLHFAACLYRSRAMYMVLSPINWLRGIKQGLCIVPKKCSFLSPNLRWIYLFVSPVHPPCGTSPRRSRHSCCTAEVSSRGRTFVNGVANVSAMVKKDPVRDVELTKT